MQNSKARVTLALLRASCGLAFALAAAIIFGTLLSGCSILWGNPGRYESLTPEQIQAYKDRGMDVYSCFTVAGPPPAGRVTYIVLPRRDTHQPVNLTFASDCQVR